VIIYSFTAFHGQMCCEMMDCDAIGMGFDGFGSPRLLTS
jgi:hypothetical protein